MSCSPARKLEFTGTRGLTGKLTVCRRIDQISFTRSEDKADPLKTRLSVFAPLHLIQKDKDIFQYHAVPFKVLVQIQVSKSWVMQCDLPIIGWNFQSYWKFRFEFSLNFHKILSSKLWIAKRVSHLNLTNENRLTLSHHIQWYSSDIRCYRIRLSAVWPYLDIPSHCDTW